MSGFRIPVARNARGRLVTPAEATRAGAHRCAACDGIVDLHAGEKKRRHFHHRGATCSAESALHASAKQLVLESVEAWLAGGPPPAFVRRCADDGCEARTRQPIPRKVARVALEQGLPSGHVVDVALFTSGLELPIAAIEIVFTHGVDARKAFELGVPWIEVDAAQVCEAAGRELVVVRDRFLPWLCAAHAGARGVAAREERDGRREKRALVRRLPFRLAEFPGFRVERVARCPRGHEALVFAWDGKEPPSPRPPLVVATENDLDWNRRATGGWSRVLPWRRVYKSACAVCGEIVGA